MFSKNLINKKRIIEGFKKKAEATNAIIFYKFSGLNCEEIFELKKFLWEKNSFLKAYKNSILEKAFFEKLKLNSSNIVIFCSEKYIEILNFLGKKNRERINGGLIEKKIISPEKMIFLSKYSSKEEVFKDIFRKILNFNINILNFFITLKLNLNKKEEMNSEIETKTKMTEKKLGEIVNDILELNLLQASELLEQLKEKLKFTNSEFIVNGEKNNNENKKELKETAKEQQENEDKETKIIWVGIKKGTLTISDKLNIFKILKEITKKTYPELDKVLNSKNEVLTEGNENKPIILSMKGAKKCKQELERFGAEIEIVAI